MSILLLLLRMFISYIFIISGLAKTRSSSDFEKVVHSFQIIPKFAIRSFVFVLPRAEIILGIFIGLGFFTKLSLILIMAFLLAFAIAIVTNILRGKSVDCGCFGKFHSQKIGWNVVLRDIILILISIAIYSFNGSEIGLDNLLISKF